MADVGDVAKVTAVRSQGVNGGKDRAIALAVAAGVTDRKLPRRLGNEIRKALLRSAAFCLPVDRTQSLSSFQSRQIATRQDVPSHDLASRENVGERPTVVLSTRAFSSTQVRDR